MFADAIHSQSLMGLNSCSQWRSAGQYGINVHQREEFTADSCVGMVCVVSDKVCLKEGKDNHM